MSIITPELISAIVPRHPQPMVAAQKLGMAADRYAIATPKQIAMFLAMGAEESRLQPLEENLNYSVATMMRVWPARFPTPASAQPYARNPEALANKVYGGRNGNAQPGDGWLYHGRGIFQLTFIDNYRLYGGLVGYDLVKDPALLLQYGVGALVAGAFWSRHGLSPAAERGDVRTVTRAINGGLTGLDSREKLYQRALGRVRPLGLLGEMPELDEESDVAARDAAFTRVLSLVA